MKLNIGLKIYYTVLDSEQTEGFIDFTIMFYNYVLLFIVFFFKPFCCKKLRSKSFMRPYYLFID